MIERALSSVAAVLGGRLVGKETQVTAVAVDSREAGPGVLFVALPGERADGHDFLAQAFAGGAAAALVAREVEAAGPLVVVPDTGRALLDLAADERRGLDATVIGITGSTGKTSVKDLAAAVLGARYEVVASPRSFNTEVGVPLTLLSATPTTEVVVCEMGSRGRGHITVLTDAARPSIGVVTNVGAAHLEMFGSLDVVADAKAELVQALPPDGTAVLNGDDPVVRDFAGRTSARVLRFGTAPDAEVRAEDLVLDDDARAAFTLRTPAGAERVELSVPGEHMAMNALAAAACGIAMGMSAAECAAALKGARVSDGRMEVFRTLDGLRVVNDAYNANPVSMAAALKAARWMARGSACVAVLGEMAELGATSEEEHERLGEIVARLGIERLVAVGEAARRIAAGAIREGVEPDRVETCDTIEDALGAVRRVAQPGDVVLVKASRRAGLERVAEALREGAR